MTINIRTAFWNHLNKTGGLSKLLAMALMKQAVFKK